MNNSYKSALSELKHYGDKSNDKRDKFLSLLYIATANIYSKNYLQAVKDLEEAELITEHSNTFELFYKRGIAYFKLENFEESSESFKKALNLAEHPEQRDKLVIWTNKIDIEFEERGIISKTTPTVDLSGVQFNSHWTQNATHILLNLDSNSNFTKEDILITLEKKLLKITHKTSNQVIFEMQLSNGIIPTNSTWEVEGKRLVFKLRKEIENFNWVNVERDKVSSSQSDSRPSYPSSNKVKKNWDNMERDIAREIQEDESKDPNGGMMHLFKDIFAKADENTRRAMMKSYQTSGGTVLSTNWSEVGDKDYEGKDKPDAPKGQEWKKYD
jgi:suppressor of G2 allele of SKP1